MVDDDPEVRKALVLAFGTICEVLEASTGEEALRILDSERPRLMLLDMVLPGMSGLEVLRASQAIVAAMSVIVLTAENDMVLAMQALDLGAVEYVTKPFDWDRLKDAVKRRMEAVSPEVNGGPPWRVDDQTRD